jgi:hypothetical protein
MQSVEIVWQQSPSRGISRFRFSMATRSRFALLRLLVLLAILLVVAGVAIKRHYFSRPLHDGLGSGGMAMQMEISAPTFQQYDSRWGTKILGHGKETLDHAGCTVCCLAMALSAQGIALDPPTLNEKLETLHGFTDSSLIIWSFVSPVTDGRFEMVVPEVATHAEIDGELQKGNPVIARVLYDNRLPHWVLITGKHGLDYAIRDPLGDAPVESMEKYPKGIYAVRYLRELKPKS